MDHKAQIRAAYNRAADAYAADMWNELEQKHFDRLILEWFAAQFDKGEPILEIGSGPGEVTAYLHRCGANCLGTDLCPQMIENARKYFPTLPFDVQDFFQLKYSDESFAGVVGFYAIVNLTLPEIDLVLHEVKRVLKENGLFLFSFHVYEGSERIDLADYLEKDNPLTFYFFKVDDIKQLAEQVGLQIVDVLVRYPYPGVEHQSKRAYFLVKKPGSDNLE